MGEETWEDVYYEADPEKRREIPAPDWVFESRAGLAQPASELEALMMSTPGHDVVTASDHDHGDTYENLEQLLGAELDLNETEKGVLDAVYVSNLSIREAADILGMPATTVWRIKDSVTERIRRRANER